MMEEIIKKAIEGGFKFEDNAPTETLYKWKIICNPLFWQALGKACGWKDRGIDKHTDSLIQAGMIVAFEDNQQSGWKYHALRFHEINLTQGWDCAVEYLLNLTLSK